MKEDNDYFVEEDNSLINTTSEKSGHCDYDIIPEDVTAIDGHSFYFCRNLRNIIVDNDNMNFSNINGVLFNKQQTILKISKNPFPTILNKAFILSY